MLPCLYTTVQNGSKGLFYGFLGKLGVYLGAGEQYTEPGNIVDKVRANPRQFAGLEAALKDGSLTILVTPSVHLRDTTLANTKTLALANGVLGIDVPCGS